MANRANELHGCSFVCGPGKLHRISIVLCCFTVKGTVRENIVHP